MNIRAAILVFPLFLAASLYGREKSDVIVMKNGDRFTCEIKKLSGGVLYTSLDYVDGTISVQWSKVARVESNQLFLVQTQGGSIYMASLKTPETPADEPVKIEVVEAPAKEVVLPRSEIVGLGQTSEAFWQRFSVSINSGLNFTKADNATQYNFGSEVTYKRPRWSARANFSSALSHNQGSITSTWNQLNLGGYHLLRWDNWFYAGLGNFLQSSQQGIQLQTSAGGGIGRFFKNTNRARISMLGGFAYQGTNYEPNSSSPQGLESVAAGLISGDVQVFIFKKTNLNVSATLTPALSEPGRVRFGTNATYSIQIISNLWWTLQFYGNWDSRPPANFSGSNYGASSGITWTFN